MKKTLQYFKKTLLENSQLKRFQQKGINNLRLYQILEDEDAASQQQWGGRRTPWHAFNCTTVLWYTVDGERDNAVHIRVVMTPVGLKHETSLFNLNSFQDRNRLNKI